MKKTVENCWKRKAKRNFNIFGAKKNSIKSERIRMESEGNKFLWKDEGKKG